MPLDSCGKWNQGYLTFQLSCSWSWSWSWQKTACWWCSPKQKNICLFLSAFRYFLFECNAAKLIYSNFLMISVTLAFDVGSALSFRLFVLWKSFGFVPVSLGCFTLELSSLLFFIPSSEETFLSENIWGVNWGCRN